MLFLFAGSSCLLVSFLSKKGSRDKRQFFFIGLGMLIAGMIEVFAYGFRVL